MRMRGLLAASLLVLGACASAPPQDRGWYHPPSELDASKVPPCAFEDPYLPEPCFMALPSGERLVVVNPRPAPTRHHGWLWWVLVGLITL